MRWMIGLAGALALSACVTAQPTQSGFLSEYARLAPPVQEGAARFQTFRDETALAGVTRVAIAPSIVMADAQNGWEPDALAPLLAEMDAELCRELAERFEITDDPTALQIRAAVTAVARTGQASSLFSAAASQAIPGPGSVRLPVGLGGLSAEAQAVDPVTGAILAQLTWARRAQVAMSSGSLSPIGDAHQMAEPFADAVARVLTVEGVEPAATRNPARCPGFAAGDAGRFVAARVTGLHFVPEAAPQPEPEAEPPAAQPEAAPADQGAPAS
jgi:hypothetical protein